MLDAGIAAPRQPRVAAKAKAKSDGGHTAAAKAKAMAVDAGIAAVPKAAVVKAEVDAGIEAAPKQEAEAGPQAMAG